MKTALGREEFGKIRLYYVTFQTISYLELLPYRLKLELCRRQMGWIFRRSINLGPLRLNFSKSGIGYSVGVRGARIGRDAKGRKYSQVSIPHTGIYRRDYYKNAKQPAHAIPPQPVPARSPQVPAPPRMPWRSAFRSPWVLYGGGGLLLYILIRAIF